MIAKSKHKSNFVAQFDQSNHDAAHSKIWLTDTSKKTKIDTWASAKDMP